MIAIIGTGFVGSSLHKYFEDFDIYNSKNIEDICNHKYDTIYCAAPSAVKWLANKEPFKDLESVSKLISCLARTTTKKLVLFSTIDTVIEGNEESIVKNESLSSYGKHRLLLEDFVRNKFEDHHILRLPGLFGNGLKKNVIYDCINKVPLTNLNDQNFQWFDIDDLIDYVDFCIKKEIRLLHLATEPFSLGELLREIFPEYKCTGTSDCQQYNMTTVHADKYFLKKQEVIEKIKDYVRTRYI